MAAPSRCATGAACSCRPAWDIAAAVRHARHFDALTAMVAGSRKATRPDSLTATGRAFPGRSRPLCAYPLHAHYKGQGNPEDAANFECRP